MLKDKKILIGVTGSIAIYKTLELIRLLIKQNAQVKVIMSPSAKKFITPLTFETISQNCVLDDSNEDWSTQSINNHISVGKWADLFVLAPCTANTINKLSNGIADNILLQTALAYPRVKLLCAAANTNMLQNPLTKASLKMLKLCNFKLIEPTTKELACQDVGKGAMAEVNDIYAAIAMQLLQDDYWRDRKVVISGGGTIEKIDDVRYISNFSSGKMAKAMATALTYRGADVCLVTTNTDLGDIPSTIHTIQVQDSLEMQQFLDDALRIAKKGKMSSPTLMDNSQPTLIQKKPYLFMVAAVSDFVPKFPQEGKLKKSDIGDTWNLELKQNTDILSSLDKNDLFCVGFKAEMDKDQAKNNAKMMLENKNLDAVCLNILDHNNTFGSSTNSIELITKNDERVFDTNSKLEISLNVIDALSQEYKD
ncbi:MAG: bifunctional phosphopantothenoylcysteine decarboxylase/phosphopantothenate--cysteine ligase CoaBC [Campylobacterota bacterium]|nr:bifunctional phosphopantothenoylcysteine decarboxylase/phosphopantothenate--cysteine ligase CoaBC [Campylobacterota bacterium]